MSTPTRRQPQRQDHIDSVVRQAARDAPGIDQGWTNARAELRDGGWPARSDVEFVVCTRGPRGSACGECKRCRSEPNRLDYADPTGEQGAGRHHDIHERLRRLEDLRHEIVERFAEMVEITQHHLPHLDVNTVPACSVAHCSDAVESTRRSDGTTHYVGMERTTRGDWVAKVGHEPLCARHRTKIRRAG